MLKLTKYIFLICVFAVKSNSSILPNFALNDTAVQNLGVVLDACYASDTEKVILGTTNGLFIINSLTEKIINRLNEFQVREIKLTQDSNMILLSGVFANENTCAIYDLSKNQIVNQFKLSIKWMNAPLQVFDGENPASESIRLAHNNSSTLLNNNRLIAYITKNDELAIYDIEKTAEIYHESFNGDKLYSLGFLSNNQLWICGTQKIYYKKAESFETIQVNEIKGFGDENNNYSKNILSMSNDGKKAVVGLQKVFPQSEFYLKLEYYLYDLVNNQILLNLGTATYDGWAKVSRFKFSADGKYLYSVVHNANWGSYTFGYSYIRYDLHSMSPAGGVSISDDFLTESSTLFFTDSISDDGNYLSMWRNTLFFSRVDWSKNQQTSDLFYLYPITFRDMFVQPDDPDNLLLYYTYKLICSVNVKEGKSYFKNNTGMEWALVKPLILSHDGKQLFSGGSGKVLDALYSQIIMALSYNPEGQTYCASYSEDDTKLLLARSNGLWVWNANTGALLNQLPTLTNGFWTAQFISDASEILTGGGDGSVKEWDLDTNKDRDIGNLGKSISYVSYMNKESAVLVVDASGDVFILDRASGQEIFKTKTPNTVVSQDDVALTKSEKYLLVENQVLDIDKKKWINTFGDYETGNTKIVQVRISPSDDWAAVRTEDGVVRIWDKEHLFFKNTEIKNFREY